MVLLFSRGQAFTNGVLGKARNTVDVQLAHDLLAVGLDRFYAYKKGLGDLFGRIPFSYS